MKKCWLWLLGEHRLLCGDATDPAAVATLMGNDRAHMAFTDPPYNVNYANSAKDKLRGTHRPILNDNLGDDFDSFRSAACIHLLKHTSGAVGPRNAEETAIHASLVRRL